MPGLVRRGEHMLVQESHQDVGLLEVPVLVRGLAFIREELRQGPLTSRKLEGTPSPTQLVTREEDEDDDDLGLVTVPLKLKFGMNLCIRLMSKV